MENRPVPSPVLFYKHFWFDSKMSSLRLIYRTEPELYHSGFILMCKECNYRRESLINQHIWWWSFICWAKLLPGCKVDGEETGFSEIIGIFAVVLLVGDAFNTGQSSSPSRQMLLSWIRNNLLMLPNDSEFYPSPFSVNPPLSIIILNQTDWKMKQNKMNLSYA